jgi:hypothetical protein
MKIERLRAELETAEAAYRYANRMKLRKRYITEAANEIKKLRTAIDSVEATSK